MTPGELGLCPFRPAEQDPAGPDCKLLWKFPVLGQQLGIHPVNLDAVAGHTLAGSWPTLLPALEMSSTAGKAASLSLSPVFPFPLAPARPLHPFPLHYLLGRQCQAGERLRPAGHVWR